MKRVSLTLAVAALTFAACGGAVSESVVENGTPAGTSSSGGTSGASGTSSGNGAACSPANGRYGRGKGGGDPACCAGLQQQYLKMRFESRLGTATCGNPPGHVEFTCVKGTCGDGICEEGEAVVCGCLADCPSAAPPPVIMVDGGAPTSCSTGGPFQRSKGPNDPPPCCPGLVEVTWKYPLPTRTAGMCGDPPGFAYFSCIKGKCGDGICETGEQHKCGCAADCTGTEP